MEHSPSQSSSPDEVSPAKATDKQSRAEGVPFSNKLENQQRRRLSVSTTHIEDDEGILTPPRVDSAATPPEKVNSVKASPVVVSPGGKAIRKYTDPALELINERTGTIKRVTVRMLLDLLGERSKSLLIFGSLSDDTQRGYDSKKIETMGSLAGTVDCLSLGIGVACKKGLKPESPNQDTFFIIHVDDWTLLGVFDGHGPYGHDVSNFVHKALPFLILADPLFETDPASVLRRCFRKTHHLLEALTESTDGKIDCGLSGTTGSVILLRGGKLYVAHVGDSRCVLASRRKPKKKADLVAIESKQFKAINLTIDHKPEREAERKRIEACGGEVRRLEGDIPHRVFIRNRMYPGLAMSRAIGDTVASVVGVISDPDVQETTLTAENEFFILATDGVWEFISSQEAVDFVCQKSKHDVQKSAEYLSYESWRRWVEEEENVVDDVTCIIFWVK